MDRRKFLNRLIAAGTTASAVPLLSGAKISTQPSDRLGKLLATRPFGRTGERLTMVCLGGYHSAAGGEKNGQALIEAALEEGIRFFDTAHKYLGGKSEELYGKFLTPKYRDDVYIMSKCDTRDPAVDAQTQLERTLKRLNTDYIDLWMIHTLTTEEDAENRVAEMIPVIRKAKERGQIRHFGVSGHYQTAAHIKALAMTRDNPIDGLLMPMSPVDFISQDSFIKNVLPDVLDQKVGQLAMKTMNAGRITSAQVNGRPLVPDRISFEENQWFVLSLPITSWVSGMTTVEQVRQNTDIARRYTKLTEADRQAIAEKVLDARDESRLQPYRGWTT